MAGEQGCCLGEAGDGKSAQNRPAIQQQIFCWWWCSRLRLSHFFYLSIIFLLSLFGFSVFFLFGKASTHLCRPNFSWALYSLSPPIPGQTSSSCVILSLWSDKLVSISMIVEVCAAKLSWNDSTADRTTWELFNKAVSSPVIFLLSFSSSRTSFSVVSGATGSSAVLLQTLALYRLIFPFYSFCFTSSVLKQSNCFRMRHYATMKGILWIS